MSNNLFPIFLKLDQINTLIVGGGNVGLEKLEALIKNDPNARITIVAPLISDEIRAIASDKKNIVLKNRRYRQGDLRNADIAILATDDRELHQRIKGRAKLFKVIVNVADTPALCDFYLGSTVKRGDLKLGISTNGQSPTFAKRYRQALEASLPEETNDLLGNLRIIRDHLSGNFSDKVRQLNQITKSLVESHGSSPNLN